MFSRWLRRVPAAFACAALVLAASAWAGDEAKAPAEKADVVLCGEAMGQVPEVPLSHAMKYPEKYAGKTVIVTGVVNEVCQKKGCWMQVTPEGSDSGVRMTFKDYGFFVPKDASGMLVRAEGMFEVKTLDKADAEHLVAEGAKLALNDDGSATEVGFVASGVELRKAKKAAD